MSTVTESVSPLQLFYWKVKFEDGFALSQYGPAGVEIHFKEFVTPQNYYLKEGKKVLNINSNCFSNLERMHGRATQAGWYPFDQVLIDQIKKTAPESNIELMENPAPYAIQIPHDGYVHLKKSIGIEYDMNMSKNGGLNKILQAYQSDLFFGYLMRDGKSKGKITHIALNVTDKEKKYE